MSNGLHVLSFEILWHQSLALSRLGDLCFSKKSVARRYWMHCCDWVSWLMSHQHSSSRSPSERGSHGVSNQCSAQRVHVSDVETSAGQTRGLSGVSVFRASPRWKHVLRYWCRQLRGSAIWHTIINSHRPRQRLTSIRTTHVHTFFFHHEISAHKMLTVGSSFAVCFHTRRVL